VQTRAGMVSDGPGCQRAAFERVRWQRVQIRVFTGRPLTAMTAGWRLGWYRRWARTRFIPDDCGLKPPIETLPQIAQERAIGSSVMLDKTTPGPWRARVGAYDTTVPGASAGDRRPNRDEDDDRVPTDQPTGRLLVSRRAVTDIVRGAALGSYGVAGFAGSFTDRVLARVGLATPGLRLARRHDGVHVHLELAISPGLPIAEVARQVDSSVRHAVKLATGIELVAVHIRVDRLRVEPAGEAPQAGTAAAPAAAVATTDEMAASGTDVA